MSSGGEKPGQVCAPAIPNCWGLPRQIPVKHHDLALHCSSFELVPCGSIEYARSSSWCGWGTDDGQGQCSCMCRIWCGSEWTARIVEMMSKKNHERAGQQILC